MSSSSTKSMENIDLYEFTESDFVYHTLPWVDKESPQLSRFDVELQKRWNKAMSLGVFRYGIDHIITRVIPGPKSYIGQLNTLRATERRKPQEISSVNQPFNENAFNFTWVKAEEIVFNLRNVTPSKRELPETHHNVVQSTCVENGSCDVLSSSENNSMHSQSNGNVEAKPERHMLIVNVSPMEFGHCLLVPQIDSHRPQILTKTSIEVALETMLLSKHRGIRMGFNSLCAFASVNHLHFHLYYLDQQLIVDYHPVDHLGGKFYEFTGLPCPGFALQLYGSTVTEMARLTHKISSYFHENDIAHNIFLCRGVAFGEEKNSSLTTIRLFIWPRKKFIGKKSAEEFNVACIELGGHLPIKEVEGYYKLTETDVDAIIADACLPPEQYRLIREHVTKMGLEDCEKLNGSH